MRRFWSRTSLSSILHYCYLLTSSFVGFIITEGNKSDLMIGSTSALGTLGDGELVPKLQVPGANLNKSAINEAKLN